MTLFFFFRFLSFVWYLRWWRVGPATNQTFLLVLGTSPRAIVISPPYTIAIASTRYHVFIYMSMRTVVDFGGRGRGLGRTKRPPGAPLERSVAMMEGWNATKIFRSNFPMMRITIAISILEALFHVCWCFPAMMGRQNGSHPWHTFRVQAASAMWFRMVQEAYQTLADAIRRGQYDQKMGFRK